jgi:quercetin dioxygenase-like cupin family protein
VSSESNASQQSGATIPPDNPQRHLDIARPNTDAKLPHIGLAGDTYTILLAGRDTAGQFCLIDMHVPPGGGPPPHRHDFEESFTILEGEIELIFRGTSSFASAGETIHIPANAPHQFRNKTDHPARLLCIASPAGLDDFFTEIGASVATRITPPPPLDAAAQAQFVTKAQSLAEKYKTELLAHA